MKKVNTFEASAIVGGNCKKVCTVEFVRGTGGACMEVTTCLDKHGKVVSQNSAKVDSKNCSGLP
ncbi:DUF4762 family protein [Serratia silvae]|uniref:DUF4762 family protein n=1 Tax=Serratia silvae TaxID=2824122 RepID=A0ABT0KI20_9GAMM|nr:DUF4762 family protein [Serratia silvae]MCL1031673.1 DUF4762 family protein [Serratia silvae]